LGAGNAEFSVIAPQSIALVRLKGEGEFVG
jgi:hypothetical protein